jgi:Na+/proline symporter
VIGSGVALGLFATGCIWLYDSEEQTLLDFVLGVMSFAYAGLLAMFCTALFTHRGSSGSAIAALIAGFLTVTAMQPLVMGWWSGLHPVLAAAVGTVKIAFPWQLVIGAAVATGVCLLGNKPSVVNVTPEAAEVDRKE